MRRAFRFLHTRLVHLTNRRTNYSLEAWEKRSRGKRANKQFLTFTCPLFGLRISFRATGPEQGGNASNLLVSCRQQQSGGSSLFSSAPIRTVFVTIALAAFSWQPCAAQSAQPSLPAQPKNRDARLNQTFSAMYTLGFEVWTEQRPRIWGLRGDAGL